MKRANIFRITNNTMHPVIMYPKKKTHPDDFVAFCGPNSWIIKDYMLEWTEYEIDLDKCYLQFARDKKKIKIKDAHQYGIIIEWEYYERRKDSYDDNLPVVESSAHAT